MNDDKGLNNSGRMLLALADDYADETRILRGGASSRALVDAKRDALLTALTALQRSAAERALAAVANACVEPSRVPPLSGPSVGLVVREVYAILDARRKERSEDRFDWQDIPKKVAMLVDDLARAHTNLAEDMEKHRASMKYMEEELARKHRTPSVLEEFSKANDAKVIIKQAHYIRTQREALQIARKGLTGEAAMLDAIKAIDDALAAEEAVAGA